MYFPFFSSVVIVLFDTNLIWAQFNALPAWVQGTLLISAGSIITNLAYIIQKISFNKQKTKKHNESWSSASASSVNEVYDSVYPQESQPLAGSGDGSRSRYLTRGKKRNLYLHPLWLTGLLILVIGQVLCFLALHLVPQSLAATLSVISLLSNVFLARIFLGEVSLASQLRGMAFVALGCILLFIASPRISLPYMDISDVLTLAKSLSFVATASVFTAIFLILYFLKTLLPDSAIVLGCMASVLNALCSVFAKCLSHLVTSTYEYFMSPKTASLVGKVATTTGSVKMTIASNQLQFVSTWILIGIVAVLGLSSLHLFNKALRYDNASRMYPLYFGLSGLLGVVLGFAFFKEHTLMNISDILLFILGAGFITFGLVKILTKNEDFDYSRVPLYVDHDADYDESYYGTDPEVGSPRTRPSYGTHGDSHLEIRGQNAYIRYADEPSAWRGQGLERSISPK